MRILITGVAGFIGSNLAERLIREGYQVVGIDNLAYGVRSQVPEAVEFHQLDIRSPEIQPLFRGVDAVFHLAAKNCISDCQQDPWETMEINVAGFARVLDCASREGKPKVIYAESSAVYEGSTLFPTPESEMKPQSFYAVSKMAGAAWAQAYERFHGLRATALRYFCVYGPRQDYRRTIPPLMSAFIIRLLKGESPVIYGTGKKRRDFVHVDDVNDFHLLCLKDARTDGQTYNLGSGTNHSVIEIFESIQGILGTQARPIYKPDLPGEAEITLGDITRAMSLGWKPRVDLEKGLRQSVDFIRREVLNLTGC